MLKQDVRSFVWGLLPVGSLLLIVVAVGVTTFAQNSLTLDEAPRQAEEWGFRPEEGSTSPVTPPAFTWRLTSKIVRWEVVVTQKDRSEIFHQFDQITLPTYTPAVVFPPGRYNWKYRGFDVNGTATNWSIQRSFEIDEQAVPLPLVPRQELLAKIPAAHPRGFVRPEKTETYKELAQGKLKKEYEALLQKCNKLLENPPSTVEPALYQPGNTHKEELDTWWGNRVKTIAVLENAATLAFVWQLSGEEKYAVCAKKLLLETAKWNPKGATGYRYNDEAGMPYNYHFARTYTFLNSYLTEEERKECRELMTIRGKEMYAHLCPGHLNKPYGSHQNRAWHFLGEIGIAFYNEIPEAEDWIWFAMNVFYSAYPVWSDSDGGWHEGVSYWNSYQDRFCWMADIMKQTFSVNAFDKPYYSQIGYYPIYLTPPGRIGGGFGDLCNTTPSANSVNLMRMLALQSGNAHWNWFVGAHKNSGREEPTNYYTFLRKATAIQEGRLVDWEQPPTDLPSSRLFQGTGQAFLNTSLLDAKQNIQVLFKSSPFGTQSHGYDANNSFYLSAWNENLLINSGRRDYYGSPHHVDWMWSTRSVNGILVNGVGQYRRSAKAIGSIDYFKTTPAYDVVVGEAAKSYEKEVLNRFTRNIVFLKPDILLVYDQLEAKEPSTFQYWLHAQKPFQSMEQYFPSGKSKANDNVCASLYKGVDLAAPEAVEAVQSVTDQHHLAIRVDQVACKIDFVLPEGLTFKQTNQYDPTPQPKITVREWHLEATTPNPSPSMTFLLVATPWQVAENETVPHVRVTHQKSDVGLDVGVFQSNKRIATIRFFDAPGKYPEVLPIANH